MIKVYLLLVIAVKQPTFGTKQVDIQTMVFKDAARCLRNAEYNKAELLKTYDQVTANCVERKIEE